MADEKRIPVSPTTVGASVGLEASLTLQEQQSLAEKYAPILKLHPDERYFPCSYDFFLKHASLWLGDAQLLGEGELNESTLVDEKRLEQKRKEMKAEFTGPEDYTLICKDSAFQGQKDALSDCRVYASVRNGILETDEHVVEILYIFMSASTGTDASCTCVCPDFFVRECNFEHVTVTLDKSRQDIRSVYYSQYGLLDGVRVYRGDVPLRGYRPIVYSAKFQHALYPAPGCWPRNWCFANDYTADGGVEWDPKVQLVFDKAHRFYGNGKGSQWLQFEGAWSPNGIFGPLKQHWWNQDSPSSNNSLHRCLCIDSEYACMGCYGACLTANRDYDFK